MGIIGLFGVNHHHDGLLAVADDESEVLWSNNVLHFLQSLENACINVVSWEMKDVSTLGAKGINLCTVALVGDNVIVAASNDHNNFVGGVCWRTSHAIAHIECQQWLLS